MLLKLYTQRGCIMSNIILTFTTQKQRSLVNEVEIKSMPRNYVLESVKIKTSTVTHLECQPDKAAHRDRDAQATI